MIFKVNGLVRWKGKKIANGIDGRFETKEERVINILQMKGFKEIEPQKLMKPAKKKGRKKKVENDS